MRARTLLVIANFLLLASMPAIQRIVGGDTRPFVAATVVMVILNVVLVASWSSGDEAPAPIQPGRFTLGWTIAAAAAGGAIVVMASRAWIAQIAAIPIDAYRADMLVVVQGGIRRVLQGRNPYTLYHVPWEAPLPYGPMLWGPYILPFVLHADLRFMTVTGELFGVAAAAGAASVAAWRGQIAQPVLLLGLAAAIGFDPDILGFTSIGHTPVYWPLLALLAWFVVHERWSAAAITAGLLVVSRTTMVAIVPVLLMSVWYRDRRMLGRVALLVGLAAGLPFLPFFLLDPRSLAYALFGSYQHVIKGYLWSATTAVQHTVGITGILLSQGLSRLVEVVQVAVMLALYAYSWRALRRGASPAPLMAAALLAFSMTTLWPVVYLYFDVFLLFAAFVIAESPLVQRRVWAPWVAVLTVSIALVIVTAAVMLPRNPVMDVGTGAARPFLRSGFSTDEREGSRTFSWINGRQASLVVPRRTAADAQIAIDLQPYLPVAGVPQDVSALLNGLPLGSRRLAGGWQIVAFDARSPAWQIGANVLELHFSSAESPGRFEPGGDQRQLSAAIDRISIRESAR